MATSGAQLGNSNAAKGKPWATAIARALSKRSLVAQKEALDELAESLLAKCDAGDLEALKELGNRLDGRPHQAVTVGTDPENPLNAYVTLITRFTDKLTGRAMGDTPQPAIEVVGPDREKLGLDTSDSITEPD